MGISAEEYNMIFLNNNEVIVKLFSTEGTNLTLTLCKVYGTTNDPKMKHIFSKQKDKDNPNKPQWSAIPYTIIREEDYDENN